MMPYGWNVDCFPTCHECDEVSDEMVVCAKCQRILCPECAGGCPGFILVEQGKQVLACQDCAYGDVYRARDAAMDAFIGKLSCCSEGLR